MPIGLLKLATFHRNRGNAICLIRGELSKDEIQFENPNGTISEDNYPDKILITSYFTYWSKYVKRSVEHYKELFPGVKSIVGGVYASLMPQHCKDYTRCDEVFEGIHKDAEKCEPAYDYLEKYYGRKEYQIIHTTRGCVRRCPFCGVYKIAPEFTFKPSIKDEILKRKIIFYDNNLLANPHIESILTELAYLKWKEKIKWCEEQSGIDGRFLEENPDLAFLLKKAGFKDIRISWDGPLSNASHIKKQIDILKDEGFNSRENLFIFMIYNWDIPFEEMELKRLKCWEWKIQISDCRYRPLDQTYDDYSGQKFKYGQTFEDYYIHHERGWTDEKIRTFRKHIRQQNICIRLNIKFYSNCIERDYVNDYVSKELINLAKNYPIAEIEPILDQLKVPYWFPENYNSNGHHVTKEEVFKEYKTETGKSALIHGNHRTNSFLKWWNRIHRNVITQLYKEQNREIKF